MLEDCWGFPIFYLNLRLELGCDGVGQVPHSLMECLCNLPGLEMMPPSLASITMGVVPSLDVMSWNRLP